MKRLLLPMILMILITGIIFVSCAKEKPEPSVDTEKTENEGGKITAKPTSSRKPYTTPSYKTGTTTTTTAPPPVYWPTTTTTSTAAKEEKKEEEKKEEPKVETATPELPPESDSEFPLAPSGIGNLPTFPGIPGNLPTFPGLNDGSTTPGAGSGASGDNSITLDEKPLN